MSHLSLKTQPRQPWVIHGHTDVLWFPVSPGHSYCKPPLNPFLSFLLPPLLYPHFLYSLSFDWWLPCFQRKDGPSQRGPKLAVLYLEPVSQSRGDPGAPQSCLRVFHKTGLLYDQKLYSAYFGVQYFVFSKSAQVQKAKQ